MKREQLFQTSITLLLRFCIFFVIYSYKFQNGNSKSKYIFKPERISLVSLREVVCGCCGQLRLFAMLRFRVVERGPLRP